MLVLAGLSLFGSACSGGGENISVSHLGLIAQSYEQFRTRNRGKAPQDVAELKAFAEGSNLLSSNGISRFDELLLSERDSQPLVLCFGKDLIRSRGRTIIGYEAAGKENERLIAFEGGVVEAYDPQEFARLIPSE